MKQRSPVAVALLPFVTLGIYGIVWQVKTKNEMNARGAQIPTAWLIIVPIVSYYWLWKYSEGVEQTTNASISTILSFVLLALLGPIGAAIIQNDFNKLSDQPDQPGQPTSPQQPISFGAPSGSAETVQPPTPPTPPASPQPVTPAFTSPQPPVGPAPDVTPSPSPAPQPTPQAAGNPSPQEDDPVYPPQQPPAQV
jgi:hypothetical protein